MSARPRNDFKLVVAGLWLIGLMALLRIRWLWPGLLFLGGATALIAARYHPERRQAGRIGAAMLVLGVWITTRFSFPALLVALGTAIILAALFRQPPAPKIDFDNDLD